MNHSEVLRGAWKYLVSYKVLWIFGIILALTTSSGGTGEGSTFYNMNEDEYGERGLQLDLKPGDNIFEEIGEAWENEMDQANQELDKLYRDVLETDIKSDINRVLLMLLWIGIAVLFVAKVLRYMSETSLIRMVDHHEETGDQMSVVQGFRLGWSRTAWRIFLIDLAFGLPILFIFLTMLAVVVVSVLPWIGNKGSAVLTISAIGLFFLTILALLPVGIVLGILKPFFRRASALNELGVFESIRQGYQVVRGNLKDVGLMWLIMLGIGLCWTIVLIPVFMFVGVSALFVGIIVGLMGGGLTEVLWGVVAGAIVFSLTLILPLAFLEGLREVFFSSTWTITYRELHPLTNLESGEMIKAEV